MANKRQVERIFNYLIIVLITSLIFTAIFISLPLTEKIVSGQNFDLQTNSAELYRKSYVVELEIPKSNRAKEVLLLEQTKNILYSRLSRLGVQQLNIERYLPAEGEVTTNHSDAEKESNYYKYLKIDITTNKDVIIVDRVVATRSFMILMQPKPGVDFGSDATGMLSYDPANYLETDINSYALRGAAIKKLQSTTGEESYFAIIKAWPHEGPKLNRFLETFAGRQIGISFDGFVAPYTVPYSYDPSLNLANNMTTQQNGVRIFAVGVGTAEEDAIAADVLYNAGVVPVSYGVVRDEDIPISQNADLNIQRVALSIGSGILGIFLYMYLKNRTEKSRAAHFALTTVTSIAIWIGGLKLANTEVEIPTMLFALITAILFIKLVTYRRSPRFLTEIIIALALLIAYFVGSAIVREFALYTLQLLFIAVLLIPVMQSYINKFKLEVLR